MMDVGGTDSRTRTGLFLWPWANYPTAAANAGAHSQQLMMGAGGTVGTGMGANMLGMPNSGASSLNVHGIDDPFETFYQRFSYPGAHAAHMSHILPPASGLHQSHQQQQIQHQQQLCSNEGRHISSRERNVETPTNLHQNTHMSPSSRTHGSSRSISPQSRASSHRNQNDSAGINLGPQDHHAAAIAAFASVAANSAVMGASDCSPTSLSNSMHATRQNMHHSIPRNLTPSELSLSGLCNGRPSSHFPNNIASGGLHSSSSPSPVLNASPTSRSSADAISAYKHLRSQQLRDFSSTAAAALAAAVVGDRAQFAAHVSEEMNNERRDGTRQSLSAESNERVHSNSHSSLDQYHASQQSFHMSSKSPLSDSSDAPRGGSQNSSHRNSLDFMRSNRLIPGLREKSAALLFRNSTVQDCSDNLTDYRSPSELLMNARDSLNPLRNDDLLGSNGSHSNSETPKSTQCAVENSLSLPHNASPYSHPAKGYKCKICQHVCFSRHDLSAHNAATHKQDPRPYRCEQCGRQFTTGAYLSQHRRIHTGVKPYACHYCDRHFTQLSHVQQHERIHTGEKPYRCTTCMKSFTQMSNLQSHQRQHMKGKPHRCEQCFMSFDTKDELDLHVQAKHSGNRYAKVLVCPICSKSYNSETYLAKHMDRHKEAASTAPSDNSRLPGSQSGVEDLFSAGFHSTPMARAAAALSLGSGAHKKTDSHFQNRHHSVAAVAAAVRCAAAAAASGGGNIGSRGEGVSRPFYNRNPCPLSDAGLDSRNRLHNDPVNYSNVHETNLFPRIPGIHPDRAVDLVAAAAAQQHHQQHNEAFGKLAQLSNTFSDFKSQPTFGLRHEDQHNGDVHHESSTMHHRMKHNINHERPIEAGHSRCMSGPRNRSPSPHPSYMESANMSCNDQQLLNLTQSQPLLQATGKQRMDLTTRETLSPKEKNSNYRNPPSADSDRPRQAQAQGSVEGHQLGDIPPPAHQQHCPQLDREMFDFAASGMVNRNQYNMVSDDSGQGNYNSQIMSRQSNCSPSTSSKNSETGKMTNHSNKSLNYSTQPPQLSPAESPELDVSIEPKRSNSEGENVYHHESPRTIFERKDNGTPLDPMKYHVGNSKNSGVRDHASLGLSLNDTGFLTGAELVRMKLPGELRVDVSMSPKERQMSSPASSSDSSGRSPSNRRSDNAFSCETIKHESSSLCNPLSTPLISVSDNQIVEQQATSTVVSELAKMIPDTRMGPTGFACKANTEMNMKANDLDRSVENEEFRNCRAYPNEGHQTISSDSPHSHGHNTPEESRIHVSNSPDCFQNRQNVNYTSNPIKDEDPIKSSWACKELLPPKPSIAYLQKSAEKRRDTENVFGDLEQRRGGVMENFNNQQLDGSKSPTLSNIPFYLENTWRHYSCEDTLYHKAPIKGAEQRTLYERDSRLTDSLMTTESSAAGLSDSSKRRRRHHYVPQHLPDYSQHPHQSPQCAFPSSNYYPHTDFTHDPSFEDAGRRPISERSSSSNSGLSSGGTPVLTGTSSGEFAPSKSVSSPQLTHHPSGASDGGSSSITPNCSKTREYSGFQLQ